MKFNYKLYRPKKVIKDISTSTSAYFRAKDVHVSPMTKIGDAAEMSEAGETPEANKTAQRKPIFTSTFDRSRLAIRTKSIGQQSVPVNRIINTYTSMPASVRQKPVRFLRTGLLRNNLPRVLGAVFGTIIVSVGLAYVHAYDMDATKSKVTVLPENNQTAGGEDAVSNQQKKKAKTNPKKASTPQKAAVDTKAIDTPAAEAAVPDSSSSSAAADTYDSTASDTDTSIPDVGPAVPVDVPPVQLPPSAPIPTPQPDPPAPAPEPITTPAPVPQLPTPDTTTPVDSPDPHSSGDISR